MMPLILDSAYDALNAEIIPWNKLTVTYNNSWSPLAQVLMEQFWHDQYPFTLEGVLKYINRGSVNIDGHPSNQVFLTVGYPKSGKFVEDQYVFINNQISTVLKAQ